MKIKVNFFQKIFIFSIFIILITIFISYTFNIFFLDKFYIHRRSQQIVVLSKEIRRKIQNNDSDISDYIETIKDKEGINIDIIKTSMHNNNHMNGQMSRNQNTNPRAIEPVTRMDRMHKGAFETIKTYNENFSLVKLRKSNIKVLLYEESLSPEYKVIISSSLATMKNYKREVSLFNLLATFIALIISALIGRVFSKKITSDLEKLNTTAKKISVLDFSEELSIDRIDEIGELSTSINTMSKNLESSIENLKAFASNASHELKTPITVINSHAQALVSGIIKDENKLTYYKTILRESIEMNDLVTNLLTISRLSSPGIKLKEKNVNILELIKNSMEKYETLELEKDIDWSLPKKDFNILGEEKFLKTAFDNIIQNALKYSKDNSTISVVFKPDKISITNVMASKLSKDKESLWEPFSRGENATNLSIDGNGLGLSIVKMILKLNNLNPDIEISEDKFTFNIKKNFDISLTH